MGFSDLSAERAGLGRWDAILFDLGGVLLNLDYSATTTALCRLAGRDLPDFYSKTRQATLFDRFERGEVTVTEFREELRRLLGTRSDDDALDAAWNALLLDVPAAHVELVLRLRATHRVYLLSNTNELHIADFLARFEREHGATYGAWSDLFHRDFYSHQLGLRKPDVAIFAHVLEREGLEPRRTLFVDDNWNNVQGARDAGLEAAWIAGTAREGRENRNGARDVQDLFARLAAGDTTLIGSPPLGSFG